jgi:hypothetical protein
VHDTDQLNLPVDLLTRLLPERGVTCPAARTHPLVVGDVVDLLAGRQVGVVPAAVPREPRCCPRPRLAEPAGGSPPAPTGSSPLGARLAAFSDEVPNANLVSTDTFSASASS